MKKLLAFFITIFLTVSFVSAKSDRTSEEYLKTARHVSAINPFAECIIEHAIKKAIKKEARGRYKVKFRGYTLASIKKGIFKYLEITGKDVDANGIHIPYFNVKTVTDYNWIEYYNDPVVFKSDVTFNAVAHLSERSINDALETEEYLNVMRKINKIAYPLFTLNSVDIKIKSDKIYIYMKYNIPLSSSKEKTFMVSSKFKVDNGKIKAYDINIDKAYGKLPLAKVANLVNLVNPLSFTVNLIKDKKCDVVIEDIKIEDDIIIAAGKIYVKKDDGDK